MDVREKLVELLAVHCDMKDKRCIGCEKGLQEAIECKNGRFGKIADHLISHGVTVQECGHWISLTECANAGVYCSVCHKKVYKEDYAWCNRKNKLRSDYCPHCGAKMTPQPPKGE